MLAYADKQVDYREGYVLFQMSKSSQSIFIQYATGYIWSHCGIVGYKGGEPYVLEASNVVKLTPLNEFTHRRHFGIVYKCRYIDKPIKNKYKKYLGIPYDSQFSLTNSRYYCSELVWTIYKEQFGLTLCKPKPLSAYHTFGFSKLLKKRKNSSKSLFVAPSDLIY